MAAHTARFYPFWSVNAPLADDRLAAQLEAFRELGFDGVVFHPRFYPDAPPYLSEAYFTHVQRLILAAADLELDFWLYDENGWPSGSIGGQLFAAHPECRSSILAVFAPGDERPNSGVELGNITWDGTDYACVRLPDQWLDYLDPQATARFRHLVLDASYRALGDEAWQHVSAVFTDEPQFPTGMEYDLPHGAIPWTDDLSAAYRRRFGEDLFADLPQIFFGDEEGAELRCRFREWLTERLNMAWYQPYRDWCAGHGVAFTGHAKGEESPLFQVAFTGSLARTIRHLHIPGLDALERHPGNGFFPRQVASLAAQFGDGRAMAECCGGAGWGATPEDYVHYLGELRQAGMTDFVLHQSQYCLAAGGITDWPPSVPLHVGWSEAWPAILDYVRNLPVAPTPTRLLVMPMRRVMGDFRPVDRNRLNPHDGAPLETTVLTAMNQDFLELAEACGDYHATDEATVEASGRVDAAGLHLGKHTYDEVILSPECWFTDAGEAVVEACRKAGLLRDEPPKPATVTIRPAPGAARFESFPVVWTVRRPDNRLRLDPQRRGDGRWRAVFQCQQPMDLELGFADRVSEVTINGTHADPIHGWDADIFRLHELLRAGRNTIEFTATPAARQPIAWLAGCFRVLTRSPFQAGPNGTVRTTGPFAVHEWQPAANPHDLLLQGLPFCLDPVEIDADLELDEERRFHTLALTGVEAAAAQLFLDGEELGWAWGPDWQVDLNVRDFLPGVHHFGCRLVPASYNFYGPHHYRLGDNPLISPAQYLGERNFVDPEDSPADTYVPEWHFLPFGLRSVLRFLPAL